MTKKGPIPPERRDEIKRAIKSHLLMVGSKEWDGLQAQFTDVSRPTFYRLINEAKDEVRDEAANAGGTNALKLAHQRITRRVETPEHVSKRVKAQLPVAPSPAIVAGLGTAADEVFNFMAYFGQIQRDADLIRKSLIKTDENGQEKVSNPVLLDRNIARRLDIIETWLHSQQLVYNLERIQELYRAVVDAVGQADPETQQAILHKLRRLNAERGLTVNMGA